MWTIRPQIISFIYILTVVMVHYYKKTFVDVTVSQRFIIAEFDCNYLDLIKLL